MSQGPFSPKIRFLGQKVCPVARARTDGRTNRQTDRHESEYRGHPFRVSGFFTNFPSTYHQGAVQKREKKSLQKFYFDLKRDKKLSKNIFFHKGNPPRKLEFNKPVMFNKYRYEFCDYFYYTLPYFQVF